MTPRPLYQVLNSKFEAMCNCMKSNNREWLLRHKDAIADLVDKWLPSGSGFDDGTMFQFENSTANKLSFFVSFHHMDAHGGYTRWTHHRVIVTPDLSNGFSLRIGGRDYKDIKNYIAETFDVALRTMIDERNET